MKKKLLAVIVAVVSLFAVCAFTGCGLDDKSKRKAPSGGNVALDVRRVAFTATSNMLNLTETTSVKDYMDALAANGELVFSGTDGGYGYFVQSFYDTKAEGNNYWAVYTDLVTLDGVTYSDAQFGTVNYEGKTLYSASYGVSSLPCVEGYTYAFVYTTY